MPDTSIAEWTKGPVHGVCYMFIHELPSGVPNQGVTDLGTASKKASFDPRLRILRLSSDNTLTSVSSYSPERMKWTCKIHQIINQ